MKLTKWTRTRHMIKRAYHCGHPVLNELGVFKLLVQPENKNARHLDWSMLLRHCMCWITFNRHDLIGSVMRADRETKWAGLQKKLLVISATGWWWWRFTAESNPFNVSIEQAYRVPVRAASPHSQKWWCSGKWCTLTTTHRVTRKCSFSRPPARPDNVYQHDSIALLRHFFVHLNNFISFYIKAFYIFEHRSSTANTVIYNLQNSRICIRYIIT